MESEFMRRVLAELRFVDPRLVVLGFNLLFIGIFFFVRKFHRKKKEKVQIAAIERVTEDTNRKVAVNREGGKGQMGGSFGEGLEDISMLHFYRLDKKHRKLKRKLPTAYTKEMCEGDIGILTYKGEEILAFEKIGSIQDEDKKRVKFQI